MSSFFVELWESVFQPGTTPALIIATHASFAALLISLLALIFLSGSIHFINLFVIAALLWASVTWFICELQKEKDKLKTNEELAEEDKDAEEKQPLIAASKEEKKEK
ncbi:unnamed protein product [Ambrosiozyma monospora]|uniref:Unnamed protein product n=1 Tax=Ambrosiozyma monospora TaxID=43982 RepID=A0A9W6YVE3_AMBMO|nr:unnamed protein product [Ambrosiozyma monospora]